MSIISQSDQNLIRNIHLARFFVAYKKMMDCLNAVTDPVEAGDRVLYPSDEDQASLIQDAVDALGDMITQSEDLVEKLGEILGD